MTIERVITEQEFKGRIFKKSITTERVIVEDPEIIEAQKGSQTSGFHDGRPMFSSTAVFPYIDLANNTDFEKGDVFIDYAEAITPDSVLLRHSLYSRDEDNLTKPNLEDSTETLLEREEINKANLHSGNLKHNVIFRWRPTDLDAQKAHIQEVVSRNQEDWFIFNPLVARVSVVTAEDGSHHLLVVSKRILTDEEKSDFEKRDEAKKDRPLYGIEVRYKSLRQLKQKAAA